MKSALLVTALLLVLPGAHIQAQTGYPAPPPGAPTAACSLDDAPLTSPVRILRGKDPVPYAFACAQQGSKRPCIGGSLAPGLVVTVGASSGEWSCVSGGDSAGWVPSSSLAELPLTPKVPLQDWIGWWRDSPGTRDRLLITAGSSPGTLRVSGRAYWYGINRNVHYGQLNSRDATPSGPYLHLVESDTLSGCVVDLHFDPARHSLRSYDNSNCGGMNVHFSGTWTRFTLSPGRHKYFSPKTSANPHVKPPAAAKSS